MNKLFARILGVTVGFAMATGIGAGALLHNKDISRTEATSYAPVYTFDCASASSNGSEAQYGVNSTTVMTATGIAAFLNNASGSSLLDTTTPVNNVSGSVYWAKGSGGAGIPDDVLKVGKASAGGAFAFHLKSTAKAISKVTINGYGWKVGTTVSVNSATGKSPTTAATLTAFEFELASATRDISVSITTSALCVTSIVLYEEATAVPPTSISCSAQSVNVASSINLKNAVNFSPATTTEKGLSFAVKSGSNNIDLNATEGIVTGKKSGSAVVTVSPTDTTGGATAVDVTITVNAIAAPQITIGGQYAIYAIDETNGNAELTGVASNLGTGTIFNGSVPPCSYILTTENGYYENTVAFKNGSDYLALTANDAKLHQTTSVDQSSSWIVTWDSDTYEATLVNALYQTRSLKYQYTNGAPRFACYAPGGTQIDVSLYPYSNKPLTNFTIDESISVYKTGKAQIAVTYTPADASDKTLTWASSNESIATVSSTGEVTGVAVGTCNVTATKTISGSTVVRTCVVTVLNNEAAHAGSSADPFNVNDAVNVAKGIFTAVKGGTAVNLDNYYYVEGIITKNVTRTTSTLTFWIGDELGQNAANNGGFEIFKASKVYGQNLGDYYSTDAEVQEDFNVGYVVRASGKLVYYNSATPEMTQGGYIYYNNYIEARTFAETFISGLEAVCSADGNTNQSNLATAWTNGQTAFAELDAELEQPLFAEVNGKTNGNTIEKCVAKYDYIVGKYNTTSVTTYADFMGRVSAGKITLQGSNNRLSLIGGSNNTILIVVIAVSSLIALSSVGMFFIIRKRKEQR